MLLVIYLAVITLSILYPASFFSPGNLRAILNNLAVDGILAVGMMALMICGVFDLSVGSMMSMVGAVSGWLMARQGWPVGLAVAAGLGLAALGGLMNGLLVAGTVNALITTLGTLGSSRGSRSWSPARAWPTCRSNSRRRGGPSSWSSRRPSGSCWGSRLVAEYLLGHTRYCRQCYYVGSNARAAQLSGIAVERVQIAAFTAMGLIAGLAGLAFAARVGAAVATAGVGAELRVITAVILGGASLSGGKGSVLGGLVGVAFMALVNNALIIARVSSYWQGIVVGVILVSAVAFDSYQNRSRES